MSLFSIIEFLTFIRCFIGYYFPTGTGNVGIISALAVELLTPLFHARLLHCNYYTVIFLKNIFFWPCCSMPKYINDIFH